MRGTAAATVPIGTAATHAPATEAIVARHPIPPHFIALLTAAAPAEDAAAAAVVCALENLGAVRPAAAALVSQIKSTQVASQIKSCHVKSIGRRAASGGVLNGRRRPRRSRSGAMVTAAPRRGAWSGAQVSG